MIGLDARIAGHNATNNAATPTRRADSPANGAFERALDQLAGRWYECRSVRMPGGSSDAAPEQTEGPEPALLTRAGCSVPPGGTHGPPVPSVERAGQDDFAAAMHRSEAGVCAGAEQLPGAVAQPGIAATLADDHGVSMVTSQQRPGPLTPLPPAQSLGALPRPALPSIPAGPSTPLPSTPAARLAPQEGPAFSFRTAMAAHSTRASEATADPACAAAPTPAAATSPPWVLTVLNAANGRVTLAMRCQPTLRATALELARHWLHELSPQARADASIVLNGEPVSPELPRRS
jgi:hypothetical protein